MAMGTRANKTVSVAGGIRGQKVVKGDKMQVPIEYL